MEIRLKPRGLAVLTLWLCLPGALIAAFVFWQGFWAGVVFSCIWAVCAALLALGRGGSVRASLAGGELRVSAGFIFRTLKRMPARFVSGVDLFSTPLLLWAGCRVLTVHSAGTMLVLAGLSAEDAGRLAEALGGKAAIN